MSSQKCGYPLELFVRKSSTEFIKQTSVFEYLAPYVKCTACNNILKSPTQCSQGHMYCESCLPFSCLQCNSRITQPISCCTVENLINNLEVFCQHTHDAMQSGLNTSNYCKWVGKLSALRDHAATCRYRDFQHSPSQIRVELSSDTSGAASPLYTPVKMSLDVFDVPPPSASRKGASSNGLFTNVPGRVPTLQINGNTL